MNSTLPLLLPAYPEIFLLMMASIILLVDVYLPDRLRHVTYVLSQLTLLGCALLTVLVVQATGGETAYTFDNMFVGDLMAHVLKLVIYLTVSACLVYSRLYLADRNLLHGEFFVFALFATLGMMVISSANHLLVLYLGVAVMALSLYAMVGLNRDSPVSTEAAIKYFVLSALAAGLLLYGMSMLYGATGQLELRAIANVIAAGEANQMVLVLGLVFLVAGIGFELALVPFHMWVPDVYDGAPNAMTVFIGSAPKLAAFALAMRLLVDGMLPLAFDWQQMLIILAVLSLIVGNVAAIAQTNIKRMLAYSTMSHMGFVLLGLLSGVVEGNTFGAAEAYGSAMFYAIIYVLMSLGSFGMVLMLSREGFEADQLSDFKGLNKRSPWYAFMMLLLMFAMAGIPPTVGFYAKLAVLQPLIAAGHVWLAVLAVMCAVVGAFYYIRVVKLMYFDEPEDTHALEPGFDMRVLMSANGLSMLVLGILPGPLMALCVYAIQAL